MIGSNKGFYRKLRRATNNEKVAPEILPYQSNIIDSANKWIDNLEIEIQKRYPPDPLRELDRLRLKLNLQELARVKFFISTYHKSRLLKIQQYILHYSEILQENNSNLLISHAERKFAEGYLHIWENYMVSHVTRHLPIQFRDLKYQIKLNINASPDMVPRPDLDRHAIFRTLHKIDDIFDEDEQAQLIGIEKVVFS